MSKRLEPTRAFLILFVIVTVALVAYGVVLQQTALRSEREDVGIINETCRRDQVIQNQYNTLLDALIEVDRNGIRIEPDNEPLAAVRRERIAAYQAGKIAPEICEPIEP